MDWTKSIGIFVLFMLVFAGKIHGQKLETRLNVPVGIAYTNGFDIGGNGLSVDVDYLKPFRDKYIARAGLEFGYAGWGSQASILAGWRLGEMHQLDLEWLNGLALYQQGAKYVTGAGAYYIYPLIRKEKHRVILSAGVRFTIQPAYRVYSPIYSYLDIVFRAGWQFGKLSR